MNNNDPGYMNYEAIICDQEPPNRGGGEDGDVGGSRVGYCTLAYIQHCVEDRFCDSA